MAWDIEIHTRIAINQRRVVAVIPCSFNRARTKRPSQWENVCGVLEGAPCSSRAAGERGILEVVQFAIRAHDPTQTFTVSKIIHCALDKTPEVLSNAQMAAQKSEFELVSPLILRLRRKDYSVPHRRNWTQFSLRVSLRIMLTMIDHRTFAQFGPQIRIFR